MILFLVFKRVTGQRDSCARVLAFLEFCPHEYIFKGRFLDPQTPGAFEVDIHSYVNPCSKKMGVHKRYFHTRLRHTDNFVGQPHLVRALEEGLRSGAPSAKMTKRGDLGLKTLVGTNSCTLLKVQRSGAPSAKMISDLISD